MKPQLKRKYGLPMPRKFGPMSGSSCSRQNRVSWSWTSPRPVSLKSLLETATTFTVFAAAISITSGTARAGTATNTRSTGPGTSARLL